jgi:hypothetical protein
MARNQTASPEVDVPDTDEVDEVAESTTEAPQTKDTTPRNPRWTPPEGFSTLAGFAKHVTQAKLHTPRGASEPAAVPSQMVYSYAKNAPRDDPFPTKYFNSDNAVVDEVNGNKITPENYKELGVHQAVNIEEGLAWWGRKNDRVAAKAQNAAQKAAKAADKGKPATADAVVEVEDGDGDEGAATEAE